MKKKQCAKTKGIKQDHHNCHLRGKNIAEENIFYNYCKAISVSGAKIRGNIPLLVDTFLKINLTLENLYQNITAHGKVKQIKNIIENKQYQAGLEDHTF